LNAFSCEVFQIAWPLSAPNVQEPENPVLNNGSPFSDETQDEEDNEACAAFSETTSQSYG
jgi:hypothetical protein